MAETGGVRVRSPAPPSERGAGEAGEIGWRVASLETARERTADKAMAGTGCISSEPTGEKVKGDGGVGVLTFSDDIAKCREISYNNSFGFA